MIYILAFVQALVILYLIRLHFGLRSDGVVRAKNWAAISKHSKEIEDRLIRLEKRK